MVFQVMSMRTDHEISGVLQRLPQVPYEWFSAFPAQELLVGSPLAGSSPTYVFTLGQWEIISPAGVTPLLFAASWHALPLLPIKWQLFLVASAGGSQHPHRIWSTALAPFPTVLPHLPLSILFTLLTQQSSVAVGLALMAVDLQSRNSVLMTLHVFLSYTGLSLIKQTQEILHWAWFGKALALQVWSQAKILGVIQFASIAIFGTEILIERILLAELHTSILNIS